MRISVIGLGYVGSVTGSSLAAMGHEVVGIDVDATKVERLNSGVAPSPEPGLDDLLKEVTNSGRFSATTSFGEGIEGSDLVIVSVGTPTHRETGETDLAALRRVSEELGAAIATHGHRLLIAIASTVPPGTTEKVIRPILERTAGEGAFALCFMPEFLREGSAIADYRDPTRFVVGARSTEEASEFLSLRADIADRHHVVVTEVAELQKSVENCWHATKVTFANELGRIAAAHGVDASAVAELLLADDRQNVSAAYMRPGFAFGGSCLPKDLRSVVNLAATGGVSAPMLASIAESNSCQVVSAIDRVAATGAKSAGILGIAFKAGTDDLRESPALDLASGLLARGIEVKIHDFHFREETAIGANLETWRGRPELAGRLVESPEEVMSSVEVVVVAQFNRAYADLLAGSDRVAHVIDLTGMIASPPKSPSARAE